MGQAPDEEEGHCQHGKTTVDTLGVPKMIVKVIVPLPKAHIWARFKEPLPKSRKNPTNARDVALDAKEEFVHWREATSIKNRYASMLITTSIAPRIAAIA